MKAVPLRRYVITAYLTFWVMVLGLCGTASMVFHAPPLVMRILADVCAWSPTIVLFCMWNQLRPAQTRRAFVASCFSGRITWYVPLLLAVIVSGGVLVSVSVLSVLEHRAFMSYVSTGGWSLPASILLSVFSGPTGEELGWRGYVREELAKRYTFIKAALIQGTVWTFWHTVLWFVDSSFSGAALVPYVISNLIVMTCLACMMNVVLEKCNNLALSMLMHFAFNFPYCFLQAGSLFYLVLSAVFLLLAAGFCAGRKK